MSQLNKKINKLFKHYMEEIKESQDYTNNKIPEVAAEEDVKKKLELINELVEKYNKDVNKATTELFNNTEQDILKA